MLQIVHNALIDLIGLLHLWITIGHKIAFTRTAKSAHAAISAALHTQILPQVIVA